MYLVLDRRHWLNLLNIIVVTMIFILPYWLFETKLFIGGDDSRLFYVYPELWLKNIAWFSWFNFSSVGQHNPQQFIVPLVALLAGFEKYLPQLFVSNFAFSAPFVLGYIFFQKMFHALVRDEKKSNNTKLAAILGGLFFIMSPIIWAITIAPFLYAVWLIALIPIILFYFLRYLQTGLLRYVVYNAVVCIILAFALYSVPWILGAIIPIAVSLIICAMLFRRSEINTFFRRALVFTSAFILTQSFWLLPFLMSFLDKSGSFAGTALSTTTQETFTPTVMATMSHNNLIFPVLNLFHRSIVFNFNWSIKSAFESVYDNIMFLNLIFIVIVVKALLSYHRLPEAIEKKTLLILFVAWLMALFLFTVNIGPLKNVFLMFGSIPGFTMFRNAYDKFAIGYVFIYATLLSFSLWVILNDPSTSRSRYKYGLIGLCIVALLISAIPMKSIVNKPLGWTKNIHTVINIPDEYSNFVEEIKRHTQVTNNILSVPFAFPGYTIIKDKSTNAVFAGTSPLKVLTGINDFSGFLSFSNTESQRFHKAVLEQNFSEVDQIFRDHNIGYVFITHNIPREVMRSYLFTTYSDQVVFNKKISSWLLPKFLGTRLVVSDNGAYELYRTNVQTATLESNNLVFKKISPVKYKLSIRNITEHQVLVFKDTFSSGWKLYIDKSAGLAGCRGAIDVLPIVDVRECVRENRLFDWEDVQYLWKNDLSFGHNSGQNGISNAWDIDRQLISDFGDGNYVRHPDGRIDVEMTLFFYPQLSFYLGIFVSIIALLILSLCAYKQTRGLKINLRINSLRGKKHE